MAQFSTDTDTCSDGLRFNELRHLQTIDFATNPQARRSGKSGVCKVRFGKSRTGPPHKPRSVLTIFDWTAGANGWPGSTLAATLRRNAPSGGRMGS
ncbi:hypothetical protein J7E83_18000 [Arthrobacter sp. ISL-48]|uniref:hypothetical protein n=1 Tax=Arthrobacter sp. ISL-48 TaxID=2819110 RepID=UPI001BECF035|nr:hypothetical protein [Arthrobacter sp. ISL-48]MBT2533982.1 hypothetical protein [Arthrobacter sp. ISL-48]